MKRIFEMVTNIENDEYLWYYFNELYYIPGYSYDYLYRKELDRNVWPLINDLITLGILYLIKKAKQSLKEEEE